jgi:uncharacterized membrane protein
MSLIFLSPLLLTSGFVKSGFLIRLFFSPICHQDPARSIHIFNSVLPVCERCSSIYIIFYAVLLTYPFLRSIKIIREIHPNILVLFLIPMLCDYMLDVFGIWKNFPLSRMISGGIAGAGLALFIIPAWNRAIDELFYTRQLYTLTKRNIEHG